MSALDTGSHLEKEVEVLFREARQRRHRRWATGLSVALLALVAVALGFGLSRSHGGAPGRSSAGLPQWSAPPGSSRFLPAQFVAGDNEGGIGVYSTTSGALLRHLSAQSAGGPDEQPNVSKTGASVYFVQPQGSCAANIEEVPISGLGQSVTAVSVPGTIALEPTPSPTPSLLAWVGSVCDSGGGVQSSVYITNRATGKQEDLGPYTGRTSDQGLAWSPDGRLLAVEAAPTVKLLAPDHLSSATALGVRPGCLLTNPAFLSRHEEIAVIRTCFATPGHRESSEVIVYSTKTTEPSALIAEAPMGAAFQSLSIDATGHVLVGVARADDAETGLIRNGRLMRISDHSPVGAQWVTPSPN